jgi:antirestriction protein ArdC
MKDKIDLYGDITARILQSLKQGTIPWKRNWGSTNETPRNWDGRPYRGINWLMLSSTAWSSPVFLTFNKAKELGGSVRKGEKGERVAFWKFFKHATEVDSNGRPKIIPMMKSYTVFNVAQCDGLPTLPDVIKNELDPIAAADEIIENMPQRPAIHFDGRGRNYYAPLTDEVHLTEKSAFHSAEGFYSVAFHELAHATGHPDRLGRKDHGQVNRFGGEEYSKEELVAELTAANLCAKVGISDQVIENQASYIAGWLQALGDDPKMIVQAAGLAAKAADCITGRKFEQDTEEAA